MRQFLFIALIACATPAAAQQTPAQSDLQRAAHMLGANWRPLEAGAASAEAAYAAACQGATDEMAALDAALPATLAPDGLGAVRTQRGLIIVPTDENPGAAYVFPNPHLTNIASGLAAIHVVDAAAGRISLTDAAGQEIQLQLGVAGGKAMMRILREGAEPLLYVGCASSTG